MDILDEKQKSYSSIINDMLKGYKEQKQEGLALTHQAAALESQDWNEALKQQATPERDPNETLFSDFMPQDKGSSFDTFEDLTLPAPTLRAKLFAAPKDVPLQKQIHDQVLSQKLGIAPPVLQSLPQEDESEAKAQIIESNPRFSNWSMKDDFNASLAQQDTKGMLGIFSAMQKLEDEQKKQREEELSFRRFTDEKEHWSISYIPRLLAEGAKNLGLSVVSFAEGATRYAGIGMKKMQEADPDNTDPEAATQLLTAADSIHKYFQAHQLTEENMVPEAKTAVGRFGQDLIRSLPTIAACVALQNYAGAAASIGSISASIAGSQYQNLTDANVSPDKAFVSGLFDATLQAPLNWLQFKGLGNILFGSAESGTAALGKEIFKATGASIAQGAAMPLADSMASNLGFTKWGDGSGSFGEWWDKMIDTFPETKWEMLRSGALAAPLGLLAGLSKGVNAKRLADKATQLVAREEQMHNAITQTELYRQAEATPEPEIRQELQNKIVELFQDQGIDYDVLLDAKTLVNLYNKGTDLITPLGYSLQETKTLSDKGQSLITSISKLHANLKTGEFHVIANIMREKPRAYNLFEATSKRNTILQDDLRRILQQSQENSEEQKAISTETMRLKQELIDSVKASPLLSEQIHNSPDPGLTLQNYVKSEMSLLLNRAKVLSAMNVPISKTLSKISFKSMSEQQDALLQRGARGSTSLSEDKYVIKLFANANLSTLFHETAHAFMADFKSLEKAGLLNEQAKADISTLRQWTSYFDDPAHVKADFDKYHRGKHFQNKKFEELSPEEREQLTAICKEEFLARGFETWLSEGKAPNPSLQNLFTRFKNWLLSIYKDVRNLNAPITDDVRQVFDRMLKTEEDVNTALDESGITLMTNQIMDKLSMPDAERMRVENLVRESKTMAAFKLEQNRTQNLRRRKEAWRKEIEQEADKTFQIRSELENSPIDRGSMVEIIGEDKVSQIESFAPNIFSRDGNGLLAETCAQNHGYQNALAMAKEILATPMSKEKFIESLIQQKQRDYEAKFAAEDQLAELYQTQELEEAVQDAIIHKLQENVGPRTRLRDEFAGRTIHGEEVIPTAEQILQWGKSARWQASRAQIHKEALDTIKDQKINTLITPAKFQADATRFLFKQRDAILSEKWQKAIEYNYKARINLELARIATERQKFVARTIKDVNRALKGKANNKIDPDARYTLGLLAQNIEMVKQTTKMKATAQDRTLQNVKDFFHRMEEMFFLSPEEVPELLDIFSNPQSNWKKSTWSEIEPVLNLMNRIIRMEARSRTIITSEGKANLASVVDEVVASIREAHPDAHKEYEYLTRKNPFVKSLNKFFSWHWKADSIVSLLEGDKVMGPVWKAIYEKIWKADTAKRARMENVRTEFEALWNEYTPKEWASLLNDRFLVEGLPVSITKEQALAVALNSGSESNLERLRNGSNFTDDQINSILSHLTEKDWHWVQKIWDFLETFRKEAFDVEERVTGQRPIKVEAREINTAYGTFRGGYYPVKYDHSYTVHSPDGSIAQPVAMNISVSHGSMLARTSKGLSTAPLDLSLSIIPRHIYDQIHQIYMREPVANVAKLLKNQKVSSTIKDAVGAETENQIGEWLKFVAEATHDDKTPIGRVLGWFRRNAALATMGFKLSTMFMQFTGFLATAHEVGVGTLLHGVKATYGMTGMNVAHAFHVYKDVCNMSLFMRTRIKSIDRDALESMTRQAYSRSKNPVINKLKGYQEWMTKHGFLPMGYIQMFFCDLPCWVGSFDKAVKEGKPKAEAIEYADLMVVRTQSDGSPINLSSVQRGSELQKILTMYYTYFNSLANLSYRRFGMAYQKYKANRKEGMGRLKSLSTKETMRCANLMLLLYFAEPILSGGLVRGGPGENADLDDWVQWTLLEAATNPLNQFIGIRDVASYTKNVLAGTPQANFRLTGVEDSAKINMNFAKQIYNAVSPDKEFDPQKFFSTGLKAIGYDSGAIPLQFQIMFDNLCYRFNGENSEWWLRDFIQTRKKEDRKGAGSFNKWQ